MLHSEGVAGTQTAAMLVALSGCPSTYRVRFPVRAKVAATAAGRRPGA